MKKLIVTLLTAVAAVAAHAQGTVVFANSSTSTVTLQGGGAAPTDGSFQVTLWFTPTDGGTLVQIGNSIPLGQIAGNPVPGRFSGGTVTTPDAANGGIGAAENAYFQVRVAGVLNGTAYSGESAVLFRPTGGGLVAAQNLYSLPNPNPNNYTALGPISLVPVPEPSVVALAVLGCGALLFRRRRAS